MLPGLSKVLAVAALVAAVAAQDACATTNTSFLSLENVCIHSDHSGACGTSGADTMNVGLQSADECRQLCCKHRDICAGFLWYTAYKSATENCTAGGPCCWLKSAVSPANKWSNDPYCSTAGVVHVPGPLALLRR